MSDKFSSDPADIIAAMGPAIGRCCYEVDEVVFEGYKTRGNAWEEEWAFATNDDKKKNNGRWMFDLSRANLFQLLKAGVKEANVSAAGYCTSCRKDFFYSHRREGEKTGRQASLIMLNTLQ